MSSAPAQNPTASPPRHRQAAASPRRILTIDGPLTRLPLMLAWLKGVETVLGTRPGGTKGGVLADYFDLIAGSGGGAVVAAMLAQGAPCPVVERRCERLVAEAISKSTPLAQLSASLVTHRWLKGPLASIFGTDGRLKTGTWRTAVCLHAFRLDTGRPHAFHNHAGGGQERMVDGDLELTGVLEACLALPPHPLPLLTVTSQDLPASEANAPSPREPGAGMGVFADARLGMTGGSAWSTWEVACGPSHPFRWPMGADQLLMVSVGGGFWTERETVNEALERTLLHQAAKLPDMLLLDAFRQERWLMESVARTSTPRLSEVGAEDDSPDPWFGEAALTWLRYDLELDPASLSGLGFTPDDSWIRRMRIPGGSEDLTQLREVGRRAAAAQVNESQFPHVFDSVARAKADSSSGARRRIPKK